MVQLFEDRHNSHVLRFLTNCRSAYGVKDHTNVQDQNKRWSLESKMVPWRVSENEDRIDTYETCYNETTL